MSRQQQAFLHPIFIRRILFSERNSFPRFLAFASSPSHLRLDKQKARKSKKDLRADKRELQDSNPRPLSLEPNALPTVLNSHLLFLVSWTGGLYPSATRLCQLLGFAVHLMDAAAGAVFVEFQAIWMLSLVLCGCVGALFAFGTSERHDDPCFICHIYFLQ